MGLTEDIKKYGVEPNLMTGAILGVFIAICVGIGIAIGYFWPH